MMKQTTFLSLLLLVTTPCAFARRLGLTTPSAAADAPMVGGFYPADTNNPFVVNAAQYAANTLLEDDNKKSPSYSFDSQLVGQEDNVKVIVTHASQQVVAGRNYKLTIQLDSETTNECIGSFNVKLWDHFGDLVILSWGKEVACSDEAEEEEDSETDSNSSSEEES
eukprot:CAMPEP_0194027362 /NCGR_PEP_ID=MMETSP0009_2-20130614/1528_1 /TAXON_ID=210454 /ORGANISM="Grammatophora oceanica, Strain CCMP 410" /LENGTH=165 /DNA_ID=CAMNT_0038666407 /DNA_START=1 /DNA_END=498 /DNA_ORIENTATION=+